MTTTSDKTIFDDEDSSVRSRKKSPSSRKKDATKHGKTTGFSKDQLPRNIKNAEGTNTNSFYYVAIEDGDSHYDVENEGQNQYDSNDNDTRTGPRKLLPDLSWERPFPYSKVTEEARNNPNNSETPPNHNIPANDSQRIFYHVQNTVPGGFPILTAQENPSTVKEFDDITDGSPNTSPKPKKTSGISPSLGKRLWRRPRYLMSALKLNRAPALPTRVLNEVEMSDKPDVRAAFDHMRDGEMLLMVEHTRWMTRTVDTNCQLAEDMIQVFYVHKRCWMPNMRCAIRGSFDIRDVMMARSGRHGLLRVIATDLPETRCLSIVFKDGKKTMNFVAPSEDSANHWVRGLNYIKKKLDTLLPRLKEELFLWEIFRKADRDGDGKLTFPEVHDMFLKVGVVSTRSGRNRVLENFTQIRSDPDDAHVNFAQFIDFYHETSLLNEFDTIFRKYSADKKILTAREIYKFLHKCQRDYEVTENDCFRIIEEYEMKDEHRNLKQMSVHGFVSFMLSPNCDVFNRRHDEVYQDMKHPLSHYFIASSHNTYLTADQLRGPSSTDAYMKALLQGCRCVELDCWDGSDDEPEIFHGYTFTSKIKFKDVIEVIGKYAFEVSRYPLILSIENHCSVKQQKKMAEYMQRILGTELLTGCIIPECDEVHLPSPAALQGKILIKGKKLPPISEDSNAPTEDDGDVSDEDEAAEMDLAVHGRPGERRSRLASLFPMRSATSRSDVIDGKGSCEESVKQLLTSNCVDTPATTSEATPTSSNQSSTRIKAREKKLKLSKDLSDQVVYCKSRKFKEIDEAMQTISFREICSFSENKAARLATQQKDKAIDYHIEHLNRTYPGATRTDSSNYDPQTLWNAGFQVVALNYQTKCDKMTLYNGKFRQNGKCGYILKPEFMRSAGSDIILTEQAKEFTVTIISGSKIDVSEESMLSVEVAISGFQEDTQKKRTRPTRSNGYNPLWGDELSFSIEVPSMAMVWFRVFNENSDTVGQFVLPFTSVAEGYRTVHLLDDDGAPLKLSYLLVHITVSGGPERGSRYSRSTGTPSIDSDGRINDY